MTEREGEGLRTLDPLITSPPPTFSVLSSSSPPPKLTHSTSGFTSEGPAVSERQTTISAPDVPHQLTSNSGGTEGSTAEIPREKEEKYNLLDTEGEDGEKDKNNTLPRIKRGAQQELRFVLKL